MEVFMLFQTYVEEVNMEKNGMMVVVNSIN